MSMELPNNGLYYNINQLPFAETLTGSEVVEIIQNGKSTKVLVSSLRGDQGSQGNDAYTVAVNNGFVGTRTEWLATLVGPRGQTGPIGPAGDAGGGGGNSTIIYTSDLVPDNAIGNNGDTLILTNARSLYEKINNKWVFKMTMSSYGAIGTLTFDEVVQVAPAGGPVKITAIPMKANGTEIGNRFNMNPCSTIRISGIATYCRNYEWSNAGTPERKNTVDSWNVELLIACDELCNVKVLLKDITHHMYGGDDVAANHATLDITMVSGHWVSAADTTPTNFGTLGYFTIGIDSTNLNEELSVSPAKVDGRFNFAHADASGYGLGSSHLKIQS